jgi:hypothetical protein
MSTPSSESAATVELSLPPGLARLVDHLVREHGQTKEEFIITLLQERLDTRRPSFEEVMALIAADFRTSGITEEKLDAVVEEER